MTSTMKAAVLESVPVRMPAFGFAVLYLNCVSSIEFNRICKFYIVIVTASSCLNYTAKLIYILIYILQNSELPGFAERLVRYFLASNHYHLERSSAFLRPSREMASFLGDCPQFVAHQELSVFKHPLLAGF